MIYHKHYLVHLFSEYYLLRCEKCGDKGVYRISHGKKKGNVKDKEGNTFEYYADYETFLIESN